MVFISATFLRVLTKNILFNHCFWSHVWAWLVKKLFKMIFRFVGSLSQPDERNPVSCHALICRLISRTTSPSVDFSVVDKVYGSAWCGANDVLDWDDWRLLPDVTVLDVNVGEVSSECVECSIPPRKDNPGLDQALWIYRKSMPCNDTWAPSHHTTPYI